MGNRTSSHRSQSYAYQPVNRVVTIGAVTYSYDANGNLTAKTDATGSWQYSWDYENRLTSVARPDGLIISYRYDALGRRVERSTSAGHWTRFSYDGADVVRDVNSDGSSVEYGNGLGLDEHWWQRASSGTTLYYVTDQLGSTRALTDASGNVVEQVSYDSFGDSAGSALTRYGFTGREHDSDTGLIYYRARWYDPVAGRFISEDPIGLRGGINLYAYVENNPTVLVDPFGLTAACANDPCDELRQRIEELRDELARRAHQLRADPHNLLATGRMSIAGHQQQFRNKQTALRNALNEFNSRGCGGGLPGDVWTWATMPTPEKMPQTNDERRMLEQARYHRNIAIGAGAVGIVATGVVIGGPAVGAVLLRAGIRLAFGF